MADEPSPSGTRTRSGAAMDSMGLSFLLEGGGRGGIGRGCQQHLPTVGAMPVAGSALRRSYVSCHTTWFVVRRGDCFV